MECNTQRCNSMSKAWVNSLIYGIEQCLITRPTKKDRKSGEILTQHLPRKDYKMVILIKVLIDYLAQMGYNVFLKNAVTPMIPMKDSEWMCKCEVGSLTFTILMQVLYNGAILRDWSMNSVIREIILQMGSEVGSRVVLSNKKLINGNK